MAAVETRVLLKIVVDPDMPEDEEPQYEVLWGHQTDREIEAVHLMGLQQLVLTYDNRAVIYKWVEIKYEISP